MIHDSTTVIQVLVCQLSGPWLVSSTDIRVMAIVVLQTGVQVETTGTRAHDMMIDRD